MCISRNRKWLNGYSNIDYKYHDLRTLSTFSNNVNIFRISFWLVNYSFLLIINSCKLHTFKFTSTTLTNFLAWYVNSNPSTMCQIQTHFFSNPSSRKFSTNINWSNVNIDFSIDDRTLWNSMSTTITSTKYILQFVWIGAAIFSKYSTR